MAPGWLAVLAFASVAGAAGLAGVWAMWRHEGWARRHTGELITLASGMLVAGSLLHLLPEAGERAGGVPAMAWALAAFAALYVAESHFIPHPHARTGAGSGEEGAGRDSRRGTVGAAAVLGLGLHGLLDGVAVGAGFSAGLLTGSVIVALVISHKLPVGIASMGILYHVGLERGRALRYSAAVALITPVAVLPAYAFLRGAPDPLLGAFVGAAGGSFLYVGAADLLPEGQASEVGRTSLLFLAGVAVIALVLFLFPG